jgi:hypothetical protein
VGRDSSVGVASRYGMEGPGIESRLGEILRTHADLTWSPPNHIYNGYEIFPRGKAASELR